MIHTLLAISALLSALLPGQVVLEPPATTPPATYQLKSDKPFHEVRVPFTFRDGAIFVQVRLGDSPDTLVEAELATGFPENTWPARLHLSGVKTGFTYLNTDANNHTALETQMVLPRVWLGNYEVDDVPGYSEDYAEHPASNADNIPVLTNSLFSQVVLTIDYHRRELILRAPDYDFTREARRPADRVLPFRVVESLRGLAWGVPEIAATVGGRSVHLSVETNWYTNDISLFPPGNAPGKTGSAPDFATTPVKRSGEVAVPLTKPLPIELGGATGAKTAPLARRVEILDEKYGATDGSLGNSVLRHFRVTFDYPRKRILLEPYGEELVKEYTRDEVVTLSRDGKPGIIRTMHKGDTVYWYADNTFELLLVSPPPTRTPGTPIKISRYATIDGKEYVVLEGEPNVYYPVTRVAPDKPPVK